MLLKTLLFAALLLSSRAAEIITKDGGILLLVDSSSQTVSIATKAEYTNAQITTMHQAMTMVGAHEH
jgi:predicted nucleic acid-binding protein